MRSPSTSHLNKGFTLIETLIVLAIFGALVGLGLFMSMETFSGTLHRSEREVVVGLLQKARSRAMNNIEQAPWGVCYQGSDYLVFKGSTCSASAAIDRVEANSGVAATSDFAHTFPVVVFTQLSGTTTATSTTIVEGERSATISITYEGTIEW
jgi:prepilin-type N-terminal cleavage/methylation domain-containing protein